MSLPILSPISTSVFTLSARTIPFVGLFIAICGLLGASSIAASSDRPVAVDRIVASVDDDPIFYSDIRRAVALGLHELRPDETAGALERRVLDELIEQRLRLHEVERYGSSRISAQQVEEYVERLKAGFADEDAWRARCSELGLGQEGIRLLVAHQLRILAYIEERLGPRVFVDLDDIRGYYDTTLREEMLRRAETLPPLEDVREQIRRVLREERLNEEIASWTEDLRIKAEIIDLYDAGFFTELPPIHQRTLP